MNNHSIVTGKQLLSRVINTEDDFEWYPTTQEIIDTIKRDIENDDHLGYHRSPSILDCGAGDGRVLEALTDGKRYAIEKSEPLLNVLHRNIFVVGTEFHHQTLIDKKVDVVFSNPPYSEYATWATKIILEANAGIAYLVIPERWKDNTAINDALKARQAEATVIGEFDFLNADRAARARVHVLRIVLSYSRRYNSNQVKVDPFKLWFDEHFSIAADKNTSSTFEKDMNKKQSHKEKVRTALVTGADLIQVLDQLYQAEMATLIGTYKKLESIDASLLREMDVNLTAVCEALELKISALKDRYWKELFDNLIKITYRLTSQSRRRLFDVLTEHTHIDFTPSNAYAVVIWVIKNANHYYDDQLIEVVEKMVTGANITLYKSNQRTYGKNEWRYASAPKDLSHYGLELRLVFHRVGGLCTSSWASERTSWGLQKSATDFLNDLRTVASNVGFDTQPFAGAESFDWSSGKQHQFRCCNLRTGKEEILFAARAHLNGNIHIKFAQAFILRLNVEFGRLKGWLRDACEAAEELNMPIHEAQEAFASNIQLCQSDAVLMLASPLAEAA